MRRQKAIWWRRLGADRYGSHTFATPVEIDCRWDDTTQEFVDEKAVFQASKSVAYVDRVMSVGDRLMLGAMESDTPDNPLSITAAYEIKRFDRNPDLKAKEFLLTAYM